MDGSQVFPDPHAAVLYYLIQVGGLVFRYDGSRPDPRSVESLHFSNDDLYDDRGYTISVERVGMQRLVQEMGYLAELTAVERELAPAAPIFAMTDGPLLWPYVERSREDYSGVAVVSRGDVGDSASWWVAGGLRRASRRASAGGIALG